GDEVDVDRAADAARAAFPKWSSTSRNRPHRGHEDGSLHHRPTDGTIERLVIGTTRQAEGGDLLVTFTT
ncbi:hypothetical protein, partial [Nesterenkonia haasae]|uniref:hypothetical protein n=1 Tax=Nesterenkonia haasae TaxID=2587813 RepID=UPI001F26F95B